MSDQLTTLPETAHEFAARHIGPDADEKTRMLQELGFAGMDDFIAEVVPPSICLKKALHLPAGWDEHAVLNELRAIAAKNRVFGPSSAWAIRIASRRRSSSATCWRIPAGTRQYTPYQAEISQGRLEALLNFQTMTSDLTGLPVANASLLDEATAAAEAMHLCQNVRSRSARLFRLRNLPSADHRSGANPRAAAGHRGRDGRSAAFQFDDKVFGALVQYPATDGAIFDYEEFARQAHAAGAMLVVAADLLALALLRPPGEFGADVAVGSAQRFGVPLGYGGPHAAFFATREACKRLIPGRLVGVSKDAQGRPALRLALQTREQHIRREKATSNICTAQALLANMASMYAVYHGPEGLKKIARRMHC